MALPPRWLGRERPAAGADERDHLGRIRARRIEQQGVDSTCADCDDYGRLRCADGARRCQACTLLFEQKGKLSDDDGDTATINNTSFSERG